MAMMHVDRAFCLTPMRAVLIGANVYSGAWGQLRWAEEDASKLSDTLRALGGAPTAIDLHASEDTATYGVVRSSIQRILKVRDGRSSNRSHATYDLALIYFSGHGEPSGDRKNLDLILNDTTSDRRNALAISDIQAWMQASPVRYVVLVLDCCFAGSAAPSAGFIKSTWENLFPTERPLPPQGFGRAILASSWHDEVSFAQGDMGGKFTHYLIEGLRGDPPPAMHPGFRQVDASTLQAYVGSRMRSEQHTALYVWGTSPVLLSQCEDIPGGCNPMLTLEQRWRIPREQLHSDVTTCELTADGQWVVLGFMDGSAHLISTSDSRDVQVIVPSSTGYAAGYPTMIVASPDSTTTNLLAITRKLPNGYALVFKDLFGTYNEQPLTASRTPIVRVKFHPSAQYVAMCNQEGDLEIWPTQGILQPHWHLDATTTGRRPINDFSFCYPAGKQLAVALEGQHSLSLWDIYGDHPHPQLMSERKALSGQGWATDEQPLQVVAATTESSEHAIVSCTTRHKRIYLWHLGSPAQGNPHLAASADILQVDALPVAFALSPNAQWLAWGTVNGDVHMIQTSQMGSGRKTKAISAAPISSLTFSPARNHCLLAAAVMNGEVRIWNYETWSDLLPPRESVPGRTVIRFSGRGERLLIANLDASLIEVWQVQQR